jgi:hypothetical protein
MGEIARRVRTLRPASGKMPADEDPDAPRRQRVLALLDSFDLRFSFVDHGLTTRGRIAVSDL